MPTITKVTGSDCLNYINRYLGFGTKAYNSYDSISSGSNYWNNFLDIKGGRNVIGDLASYVK